MSSRRRRYYLFAAAAAAASGPSYDADAEAYFTAATVTETAYKDAINQFVLDLKAASIWTKFDRLWVLANQNETAALTCLVSLNQDAAAVNSPTFTAGTGFTLNGSSQYINTGIAMNGGTNYTQNSASYGVALTTASTGTNALMGATPAGPAPPYSQMIYLNTNMQSSVNYSGSGGESVFAHGGRSAFWIASRNAASGAGSDVCYKNGSSVKSDNITSAAPAAVNFFIGCRNVGGTPTLHTAGDFHLGFTASDMDGTEAAAFDAAVDTLKASIGW